MQDPARQIESPGVIAAPQAQLSALTPPIGSPAPTDGGGPAVDGHRWAGKLGSIAAKNRWEWYLARSENLTPRQIATLEIVARLEIQFWNACNRLDKQGQTREDGEPKALLGRVLELQQAIRSGLAEVYGEGEQRSW